MTNFRHIRWANDPGHISARFHDYRRLMEHWRQVLPAPVLEVDYEETASDLEGVARRLVDWCGLDWEPACLAFHQGKQPVRTASVVQVRQPVYTRSVGRWRHYERSLGPCLPVWRPGRMAASGEPSPANSFGQATVTCSSPSTRWETCRHGRATGFCASDPRLQRFRPRRPVRAIGCPWRAAIRPGS
jgi:hypothetical protein